jgi:hypothetical protein
MGLNYSLKIFVFKNVTDPSKFVPFEPFLTV